MPRDTHSKSRPSKSRPRPSKSRSRAVVAGLAMALLVVLVHQKLMGYDRDDCAAPRWTVLDERDDGLTLRQRSGRCKLEIDLRGELRWNETEDAIVWLEPGGRLDVEQRTLDARHRLKVRADADGTPQVEYWRDPETPGGESGTGADGSRAEASADRRAWLHEVAMVMFRRLGVDAASRSHRIFESQGAAGLVAEIEAIDSDHVASLYARAAFEASSAAGARHPDDLATVLRAVADHVGSDHSVARLLEDLAAAGLPEDPPPALLRALEDVLAGVGSDFELRRSVLAFLESSPAPAVRQTVFDAAAHGVGSDHDAAEVVVAYAASLGPRDPLDHGVFRLLRILGSDFEMRRSLLALLATERTDDDLRRILDAARDVGSDYDLAEVLVAVSNRQCGSGCSDAVHEAYDSALEHIGADFERRRAAEAWRLRG